MGQGEMRAAGLLPGTTFADAVMVELRDIHAALFMEQICAFQPSTIGRLVLRAYDAIHLATADRLYRETRSRVVFACSDGVLNRAASTLGLILVAQ
ncbi:MAG: hypothetical protein ACLPZJ_21690 [Terriglobales bacterium]